MMKPALTIATGICLFITVAPSATRAAETLLVDLDGTSHVLIVEGCRTGDGYYLIDAKGDGASISLVGSLEGDSTYTTIDFFFADAGEDKRAGASIPPIPLQDGAFAYAGPVDVSDGSTAKMLVNFAGC